jgi:NAD(P)-dependent dehydrogenase (short-subunit alcohol dehydrogenase family)
MSAADTRPSLWRSANPPLSDWRDLRVWVVGASSGIGEACADAWWHAGAHVTVSARQADALQRFVDAHPADDQHHAVKAESLDVTNLAACQAVAERVLATGAIDLVLFCAGHYKAMRATAMDVPDIAKHNAVNYMGAVHVSAAVVPALLTQGHGHISFISSVAGFRGLPNGLAYGPSKAALTHWAQTLYIDLAPHGIGVSVVHPGFVQTPLTAQNEFKMPAIITPTEAAQAMMGDWARGVFEIHYPKRFTRVLKVLRCLPHRLYCLIVQRATGL